jgi:hypothetical protein
VAAGVHVPVQSPLEQPLVHSWLSSQAVPLLLHVSTWLPTQRTAPAAHDPWPASKPSEPDDDASEALVEDDVSDALLEDELSGEDVSVDPDEAGSLPELFDPPDVVDEDATDEPPAPEDEPAFEPDDDPTEPPGEELEPPAGEVDEPVGPTEPLVALDPRWFVVDEVPASACIAPESRCPWASSKAPPSGPTPAPSPLDEQAAMDASAPSCASEVRVRRFIVVPPWSRYLGNRARRPPSHKWVTPRAPLLLERARALSRQGGA